MTRFLLALSPAVVAVLFVIGLQVSFADEQLAAGDRLAAEGRIDEARQTYARIAEERPDNAEAHARLGGMQLIEQRYSEAIESFQRAISLDGAQSNAFVGMGMAYLHLGRHALARAAFDEARRLRPELSRDIDPVLAWLDSRTDETDAASR